MAARSACRLNELLLEALSPWRAARIGRIERALKLFLERLDPLVHARETITPIFRRLPGVFRFSFGLGVTLVFADFVRRRHRGRGRHGSTQVSAQITFGNRPRLLLVVVRATVFFFLGDLGERLCSRRGSQKRREHDPKQAPHDAPPNIGAWLLLRLWPSAGARCKCVSMEDPISASRNTFRGRWRRAGRLCLGPRRRRCRASAPF